MNKNLVIKLCSKMLPINMSKGKMLQHILQFYMMSMSIQMMIKLVYYEYAYFVVVVVFSPSPRPPPNYNRFIYYYFKIGTTNVQECVAYAPVKFDSSTTMESPRHGTATFSSSILPVTEDEFYQFYYIINKQKCLGSSIPFQLNCSIDDIDLLSEISLVKSEKKEHNYGLIALSDHDNDDLIVIHTKQMLIEEKLRQENRQLLDLNRNLEQQRDKCKAKLDLLELQSNEYINKIKNEMQVSKIFN